MNMFNTCRASSPLPNPGFTCTDWAYAEATDPTFGSEVIPPALESPLRGESGPAGAFCDEFALIQRQKCQLRSERKLGRKAEALPHEKPGTK